MRGLKSTIGLLVILGGLVGYIYYLNRDGAPDGDAKEKAFAAVAAEDIEEVQIKSADGETSRAQKTDGTWRLVEPVQAVADELLRLTRTLTRSGRWPSAQAIAADDG